MNAVIFGSESRKPLMNDLQGRLKELGIYDGIFCRTIPTTLEHHGDLKEELHALYTADSAYFFKTVSGEYIDNIKTMISVAEMLGINIHDGDLAARKVDDLCYTCRNVLQLRKFLEDIPGDYPIRVIKYRKGLDGKIIATADPAEKTVSLLY